MTTIGIQLGLFSGQTNLTLWLFNNGVLLNTGGDTLTEVGTSGFFQATVAESITTSLSAVVRQAGVLVYEGVLLIGQTVVDFNPIPLDAAGTRSALDWTQVRHRLGIDGTKETPASSNPDLGNVAMSRLIINNTTPGQAAIYIGANNATVIEYEDTDQSFAASFNPEIGYALVGGARLTVNVQTIVANAIGSDQLAASAITEIQTGLATSSQVNAVGVIAATIEGNMATDAKQDQILDAISGIGGGPAPGAVDHELTVELNGSPEDGVAVWVTTDQQGTDVIAGTKYTDGNGKVEFLLDPGVYYAWCQKNRVKFTNPTSFEVPSP